MRTFYRIYKIKYVLKRIKKEVCLDWEMLWFRVPVQAIYASVLSSRVNITLVYQRCVSLKGGQVTLHHMVHQAWRKSICLVLLQEKGDLRQENYNLWKALECEILG